MPWRGLRSTTRRPGCSGARRAATARPTTPAPMIVTPVSGMQDDQYRIVADFAHFTRFEGGSRMKRLFFVRVRTVTILLASAFVAFVASAALAQAPKPTPAAPKGKTGAPYPSDIPAKFEPVAKSWDFERRIAEIPMRD